MKIEKNVLGKIEGKNVFAFDLSNDKGISVRLTDLGAQTLSIKVPDKNNNIDDITLHYSDLKDIYENPRSFGAIIARNANRIANAKFNLNGIEYILDDNNGGNNLHSGYDNFHKKICQSKIIENDNFLSIEFFYHFKDMEQAFPGDADFRVIYTLDNDNSLTINYKMISNKDTIFNPTSHIYWNLLGHKTNDIMGHTVKIFAEEYTPINNNLIPNGIEKVEGTPLDFYSKEKCISCGIDDSFTQIKIAGGFDHNFLIKDFDGKEKLVAKVYEPTTKRELRVYSDREGLQFYSGNFIGDILNGKDGASYNRRAGFCLETQHVPNAINNPNYISPVIKAGVLASTSTRFQFL